MVGLSCLGCWWGGSVVDLFGYDSFAFGTGGGGGFCSRERILSDRASRFGLDTSSFGVELIGCTCSFVM